MQIRTLKSVSSSHETDISLDIYPGLMSDPIQATLLCIFFTGEQRYREFSYTSEVVLFVSQRSRSFPDGLLRVPVKTQKELAVLYALLRVILNHPLRCAIAPLSSQVTSVCLLTECSRDSLPILRSLRPANLSPL